MWLALQARADGFFPLLAAVKNSRHDHVECLLAAKANVNQIYPKGGNTALMTASLRGLAITVKTLLAHRADATAVKPDGGTALLAACSHGSVEVVSELLDAKADPSQCLWDGMWSPLMQAADRGRHPTHCSPLT